MVMSVMLDVVEVGVERRSVTGGRSVVEKVSSCVPPKILVICSNNN